MSFLLQSPEAEAASRALLHFLWQGAAVGIVAAVVMRMLARSTPQLRYLVACLFLVVMIVVPVVTWTSLVPRAPGTPWFSAADSALHRDSETIQPPGAVPAWIPLTLAFWFTGVLALAIRATGGWLFAWRSLSQGRFPASETLRDAVTRTAARLRLDRVVRVFESRDTFVPVVFGALRPVLIVPASLVPGMPPRELEAILAHELAHVARHDFLVNCLQTVVEVLLFYHPAVWWLSRRIRQERELCCDRVAARLCGDPVLYSRALLALEDSRQQFALAATGGNLTMRIQYLVRRKSPDHVRPGAATAIALATCALALVTLWAATAYAAGQSDPASQSREEHDRRTRFADTRFQASGQRGSETDRGRIYIQFGPPDEIIKLGPPDGITGTLAPERQVWRYRSGREFTFEGPDYRLASKGQGLDSAVPEFPSNGETRIRVGSGVMQKKLLFGPKAEPAGAGGSVTLAILVNQTGRVSDVRRMNGPSVLAESAEQAVRAWTYEPVLLNGNPVEVVTVVRVEVPPAETH